MDFEWGSVRRAAPGSHAPPHWAVPSLGPAWWQGFCGQPGVRWHGSPKVSVNKSFGTATVLPMPSITSSSRPQPARPRVVIVEDHAITADYYAWVLKAKLGLEVCGRAVDARGGMRRVEQERPDLVIVDLTLAQGHGLELTKDMTRLAFQPKVLVVSAHDEAIYAERALEAGATGYLRKTHDTVVFMDAVRRVLAGLSYVSPEVMTQILHRRRGQGGRVELTDREVQVLEGMGQGRTMKEIAAFLGIDAGTIETYRSRLREKLGVANSDALRMYAFQWVHLGVRPPGLAIVQAPTSDPDEVRARTSASPEAPSGSVP